MAIRGSSTPDRREMRPGQNPPRIGTKHDIDEAAALLLAGKLVAFPTETVYGLGADATNDRAVAGIFDAKCRPRFNPLITHVVNSDQAQSLVIWTELAEKLTTAFWPGPLTVILPKRTATISMLVSAGGDTLALRAPDHPLAQALLHRTARPIAAPSANPAGRISPTTAEHVAEGLGDRVDLIIDGGPCQVGLESSVVDLSTSTPHLLRPGGVPTEEIAALVGQTLAMPSMIATNEQPLRSPGQLSSHYAPKHLVRLDAVDVAPDEALLAFGPSPPKGAAMTANLSVTGDLREAAGHLFAMLRHLDQQDVRGIAVMPIPAQGLGEAIRDRLTRAAIRS